MSAWKPSAELLKPRATTSGRLGQGGLGVGEDRIYLDHGLTGTHRERPGLAEALAAVRAGDTLVVPKLDRLARTSTTGLRT